MEENMTVDVHGLQGFTEDQKFLFRTKVVPLLEKTINSEEFKERIINYKYGYYITTGRFWNRKRAWKEVQGFKLNNGLCNEKIYEMFRSGIDKYNADKDHDLDLFLTIYYSRKNVIGYTMPSTFKTWVNRKFFAGWLKTEAGRCNIVGNIVHEYMHNLGFGHAFRNNSTRKYTVPYAFGYIASDVARKFL